MSLNVQQSVIFVLALLVINCSANKSFLKASGNIAITIDDVVDRITVNAKDIALNGPLNRWDIVKNIPATIYAGDEIAIYGTNLGGPDGILATIDYFDESGEKKQINTGAGWFCDGKAAALQGKNGVGPWGTRAGISADAQWIWNPSKLNVVSKTVCTFKVPKDESDLNGTIVITIDDVLDKITVNGAIVSLAGVAGLGDWTKVKTIKAHLKAGDEIAIHGTNGGGPDGILADISYVDHHGVKHVISTGQGWSCDGKPAALQGKNGVGPWGTKAGISADAQWIWNPSKLTSVGPTVCTFTLPRPDGKRCNKTD